jgi:hypothetical protein
MMLANQPADRNYPGNNNMAKTFVHTGDSSAESRVLAALLAHSFRRKKAVRPETQHKVRRMEADRSQHIGQEPNMAEDQAGTAGFVEVGRPRQGWERPLQAEVVAAG